MWCLSLLDFCYFLDKGYKYEPYFCNGCHHLMQKVTNFNDVAIVSVNGSDCRIHFWYMSKDDAINIMKSFDLNKNCELLYFLYYI